MRFKRRAKAQDPWNRWFAWHPVFCEFDKCWVWLEMVDRCWDNDLERWQYETD